jgi:hypothetical protein
MASLDMSKGSDGFNMMGDVFAFLKKYGTPEKPDDVDYWDAVVAEHQKLCDKYKGNKTVHHLLINMMTGVLSHLESEVTTWKE